MPTLRLADQYTTMDMLTAALDCLRRKRQTVPALEYLTNFEHNLLDLQKAVNEGTYEIGPSQAFVVKWPKVREVWAADFRDRIIHHAIYLDVVPWLERRFIGDTFACIKGRGTHSAIRRLEHFVRRLTGNWTRRAWYLQIDLANFFVSMHRGRSWAQLSRYIGTTSLTARLWRQVIMHNPTSNAVFEPWVDFGRVPRHKSLWSTPPEYGFAIGNLPSQFLANLRCDPLDKFVKHTLRCHNYVRYVDDAVLLSDSRQQLYDWHGRINEFLQTQTELRLHPDKTVVAPADSGINFVGAIVKPWRTLPRPQVVGSARRAAIDLWHNPTDPKRIARLNSYLGMMVKHKSYKLRRKICKMACLPYVLGHDAAYTKVFAI